MVDVAPLARQRSRRAIPTPVAVRPLEAKLGTAYNLFVPASDDSGNAARTTRWDAELERLCDAVVEAFGRDELTAALTRAYALVATHTRITNIPRQHQVHSRMPFAPNCAHVEATVTLAAPHDEASGPALTARDLHRPAWTQTLYPARPARGRGDIVPMVCKSESHDLPPAARQGQPPS